MLILSKHSTMSLTTYLLIQSFPTILLVLNVPSLVIGQRNFVPISHTQSLQKFLILSFLSSILLIPRATAWAWTRVVIHSFYECLHCFHYLFIVLNLNLLFLPWVGTDFPIMGTWFFTGSHPLLLNQKVYLILQ